MNTTVVDHIEITIPSSLWYIIVYKMIFMQYLNASFIRKLFYIYIHNIFEFYIFKLILKKFFSSQKEDEIEEYLRKKYADESIATRHFGDGGEEMSDEITQQTLLPGVKDPNLWMVKCRIGEEKATVLLLMRKFITYQFSSM